MPYLYAPRGRVRLVRSIRGRILRGSDRESRITLKVEFLRPAAWYYCSKFAGPPRLSEIYAKFGERVEHRGGNASLTLPSIFLL
jgi:hypothetical protein